MPINTVESSHNKQLNGDQNDRRNDLGCCNRNNWNYPYYRKTRRGMTSEESLFDAFLRFYSAFIAQRLEHPTFNREVLGSSPNEGN